MDKVTVERVETRPLARDHLHGFNLGTPTTGLASSTHSLSFTGWLAGKTSRADKIEVLQDGRAVLAMPVSILRQDLSEMFPEHSRADNFGFNGAVGSLRLRPSFELLVRGSLESGVTIPLATISGRRESVSGLGESPVRPVIVTTLGRTGSTWCVWLLQCHPEIVAHSPFDNDARVGSYWMSVLQTLSDPASYLRQLIPGKTTSTDWWTNIRETTPGVINDSALSDWLGTNRVRELAEMCRDRIASFYEHQAATSDKEARFFVEKYLPRQVTTDLLRDIYPDAAEIVLVRDLRDMFCSILAFNRKRGFTAFGRESVASDVEYIETVKKSGEALLHDLRAVDRDVFLLRYEDMMRTPIAALEPLLSFLDLDPGGAKAMVEFAATPVEGMNQHRTAKDPNASIGRWRRDLDPTLVERCDEILSPVVAEFGYETAGSNATGA